MKIWNEKPAREAVEELVRAMFVQLRAGAFEEAKELVDHAYADWSETLFTVWEDHYLIHETPKDKTFAGNEWQTNRAWTQDLALADNIEWIKDDILWVDFLYRGAPSGYIGEFQVVSDPRGFFVRRNVFRMA